MRIEDTRIRFDEGGVTIDADLAARGLGFTDEAFRTYLRQGIVYSLVERGEGEDEGRIRLTLRCRSRRWSTIIETRAER